MTKNAIQTEKLGKAYRIYPNNLARLIEGLSLGRLPRHREFRALHDLSFSVPRGSSLGICGSNGAGKSTLLEVLAGTKSPSSGRYRIDGRITSLLDLGAGLLSGATGRENARTSGILRGWRGSKSNQLIEQVHEFSELGEFFDAPLRTYSAGMAVRLGFSIAMSLQPDVLILDEVFAVGDSYFQKKCVDRLSKLRKSGATLLFCSHSIYDLRQLCDRALWLNGGQAAAVGDVVEVTGAYQDWYRSGGSEPRDEVRIPVTALSGARHHASNTSTSPRHPSIQSARIYELGTNRELDRARTGDSIEIQIQWDAGSTSAPLQVGIGFIRRDNTLAAGAGTHFDARPLHGEHGCIALELPEFPLLAGEYIVAVWLLDEEGTHRYHEYSMPKPLQIHTNRREPGVCILRHTWSDRELSNS